METSMQQHSAPVRQILVVAVVTVAFLACNLQAAPPSASTEAPGAVQPTSTISVAGSPEASATASPTQSPTASPTFTQGPPPAVTVSATGGRLNVRRGPGPEYDTVGAFLNEQSSTATARNADGTWVLINIPKTSKSLGWITLETKYTSVSGVVSGLPVMPVAAALPAFIRNCTGREMLINPIGAILLPRGSAPENQLQFFPGEYTIIDMETETAVGDVTVFEGKTIDIKQDSSGKKFSC
jgi:hypothetical protein